MPAQKLQRKGKGSGDLAGDFKRCNAALSDARLTILHRGAVRKRGKVNKAFKVRHFVLLYPGCVFYFKTEKAADTFVEKVEALRTQEEGVELTAAQEKAIYGQAQGALRVTPTALVQAYTGEKFTGDKKLNAVFTVNLDPRWIQDEAVKGCAKCKKTFSMFNRRHHCRFCGQIFCAAHTKGRYQQSRSCEECLPLAKSGELSAMVEWERVFFIACDSLEDREIWIQELSKSAELCLTEDVEIQFQTIKEELTKRQARLQVLMHNPELKLKVLASSFVKIAAFRNLNPERQLQVLTNSYTKLVDNLLLQPDAFASDSGLLAFDELVEVLNMKLKTIHINVVPEVPESKEDLALTAQYTKDKFLVELQVPFKHVLLSTYDGKAAGEVLDATLGTRPAREHALVAQNSTAIQELMETHTTALNGSILGLNADIKVNFDWESVLASQSYTNQTDYVSALLHYVTVFKNLFITSTAVDTEAKDYLKLNHTDSIGFPELKRADIPDWELTWHRQAYQGMSLAETLKETGLHQEITGCRNQTLVAALATVTEVKITINQDGSVRRWKGKFPSFPMYAQLADGLLTLDIHQRIITNGMGGGRAIQWGLAPEEALRDENFHCDLIELDVEYRRVFAKVHAKWDLVVQRCTAKTTPILAECDEYHLPIVQIVEGKKQAALDTATATLQAEQAEVHAQSSVSKFENERTKELKRIQKEMAMKIKLGKSTNLYSWRKTMTAAMQSAVCETCQAAPDAGFAFICGLCAQTWCSMAECHAGENDLCPACEKTFGFDQSLIETQEPPESSSAGKTMAAQRVKVEKKYASILAEYEAKYDPLIAAERAILTKELTAVEAKYDLTVDEICEAWDGKIKEAQREYDADRATVTTPYEAELAEIETKRLANLQDELDQKYTRVEELRRATYRY